jgi:large subunit ribosomal protein L5
MTLKERYQKEIAPTLAKDFGIKNPSAVPKVTAVTLSIGTSQGLKDPKFLDIAENTLQRITGQKPVRTKAKKSIASFKIREGMIVGMRVTLRGPRMWHFLEKLLKVTFPRIRDFRGIPSTLIDDQGSVSIGFREFLAFPEIRPDEVERVHGLQVTITTTAKNRERGQALLTALGLPFKD